MRNDIIIRILNETPEIQEQDNNLNLINDIKNTLDIKNSTGTLTSTQLKAIIDILENK